MESSIHENELKFFHECAVLLILKSALFIHPFFCTFLRTNVHLQLMSDSTELFKDSTLTPKMTAALLSPKRDVAMLAFEWCISTPNEHFPILCNFTDELKSVTSKQALQVYNIGLNLQNYTAHDDLTKEFIADLLKRVQRWMSSALENGEDDKTIVKAIKELWNTGTYLPDLQYVRKEIGRAPQPTNILRSSSLLRSLLVACDIPVQESDHSSNVPLIDTFLENLEETLIQKDIQKIEEWYAKKALGGIEKASESVANAPETEDIFDDLFDI